MIDAVILALAGGIIGAIVTAAIGVPFVSFFFSLLIALGYYVTLNANGGTFGKEAVGLRLEDAETGEDIGYPRSLGRYFVAFVSAWALLLGLLWCIWDSKKQTWHDKAVGAVVVRV